MMEAAMGERYFGDDFGQKIDLTVRIREILRNYPEGSSIFKEMIQNADDAGATQVNFCLDYRHHPDERLAYGKLQLFQGPSLLVHNNAAFTKADFESIQRIGDSLKKVDSNGWKTGRFGVGFNSVYHLTDLPAFVSDSALVLFDPQACHLPQVNPSNPGKLIDFLSHKELLDQYPDQFAPFRCFGCDFTKPFSGTIFRLALRSPEQAKTSKLSSRPQGVETVSEMLREFSNELSQVLLFLRNVIEITVFEWKGGQADPKPVFTASIKNLTTELSNMRSLRVSRMLKENSSSKFSESGEKCDYQLSIESRNIETNTSDVFQYLVCNQLGGGSCSAIANHRKNENMRLVPWGGVAVRISNSSDCSGIKRSYGHAFCFLPLPAHTYMPIHVNGFFELSSNRRDIWFGEDLGGDGLLRAKWNVALLEDVIAPCYARAVCQLAGGLVMHPDEHTNLFPDCTPPPPWDALALSFFKRIQSANVLFSAACGGGWVAPNRCLVIHRGTKDQAVLAGILLEEGLPIVQNLTEAAEQSLIKAKVIDAYLTPAKLRALYRKISSKQGANSEALRCIWSFITSDLNPRQNEELIGVRLLPLVDGSLATIERNTDMEADPLKYLCSMGFSRIHAACVLRKVGDMNNVDQALNWLISNPNPATVWRHDPTLVRMFFIGSDDEVRLLKGAERHLINTSALCPEAIDLLVTRKGMLLNVENINYESFAQLLCWAFPLEWYGRDCVEWSDNESELSEEWFRNLWKYIGPNNCFEFFRDRWPITPTSSGVVCALSAGAGVLSGELVPEDCIACLRKIGVRVLLSGLLSSVQPHPDLWKYIHQPTPSGVVSAMERVMHSDQEIRDHFRVLQKTERDSLRCFLMSGPLEELNDEQREMLKNLPIFHGFRRKDHFSDNDLQWGDGAENSCDMVPVFASLRSDRMVKMCRGIRWQLLLEGFVVVEKKDDDLYEALKVLRVEEVSKAQFYCSHVLPRLESMSVGSRVRVIASLLDDLAKLLAEDQDGILGGILESSPVIPCVNGDLRCIRDLYDPEIEEFASLMDDSFFPAIELQETRRLASLRSIGLQRTLTRRSILSLALSVENEQHQIMIARVINGEQIDALRERAEHLFKYVDAHISQLTYVRPRERSTTPSKLGIKKTGMKYLRSLLSDDHRKPSLHSNKTNEEVLEQQALLEVEIHDFVTKLAIVSWVPIQEKRPHPNLPWPQAAQDARMVVAAPASIRPASYQWLCSAKYRILAGVACSTEVRGLFRWDATLPSDVVAAQLTQIALLFNAAESTDPQPVWEAVFQIYRHLTVFYETELDRASIDKVSSILLSEGVPLVWVGDRFVSADRVATSIHVNAEPYLFSVPNELIHFRPFLKAIGVRDRFGPGDFVNVLEGMSKKSQQPLGSGDGDCAIPLSSNELILAVALVQTLSDQVTHHSDWEILAPDTDGVLRLSSSLTYDDAPWLDKRQQSVPHTAERFIHPKISNDVAARVGAKSLRSQLLLSHHHESISFDQDGFEHFGQTEALTKRISHILEQYPDGSHVISELIQNADDAGASIVKVLYSAVSHGNDSLLSPEMSKWQGPSIYCYNDAQFRDADFVNLARIGQGNKLNRPTTTGRFGLGFNSVYHFTDLPCIVSGGSLVMFDPHAAYLPGISPSNPGIRIRFVDSCLMDQFPDQFKPLRLFGCNLQTAFDGTLFRFPLRNHALAQASEIKRHAYSEIEIAELFNSFRNAITSTMIFLRSVRKVDVFIQGADDEQPILLFGAEVPSEDRGVKWQAIDRFIRGESDLQEGQSRLASRGEQSKSKFNLRFASAPDDKLPRVSQHLHINYYETPHLESIVDGLKGESRIEFPKNGEYPVTMLERVEEYLVCSELGGGRAKQMACGSENEALKRIPYVGVAACMNSDQVDGRAFCFLPLPVRTGLPVHINGYFELSSNRRDIWYGDDMTGHGRQRSDWNLFLLQDAVAPAYLRFLLEAKEFLRQDYAKYLALFPSKHAHSPWSLMVEKLFELMRDKPVFISDFDDNLRGVTPAESVLVDDGVLSWKLLEKAIIAARLFPVFLPPGTRSIMIELNAVHGTMTPEFFRHLLRSMNVLLPLDRDEQLRVVQFCLEDCRSIDSYYEKLHRLPILAKSDGTFSKVAFAADHQSLPSGPTFYFCARLEEELLDLAELSVSLRNDFKSLFDGLTTFYDYSNVKIMTFETMCSLMGRILPLGWRNLDEIAWLPGINSHPTREWMQKWWRYFEEQLNRGSPIDDWVQLATELRERPIIPTVRCEKPFLVRLCSNAPLLIPKSESLVSDDMMNGLVGVFDRIGIRVLDTSIVAGEKSCSFFVRNGLAKRFTADGVLDALGALHPQLLPEEGLLLDLNSTERDCIRGFVTMSGFSSISPKNVALLERLAVFPVHRPTSALGGKRSYVCLRKDLILTTGDADECVMDEHFYMVQNEIERRFIRDYGVAEWDFTRVLLEYVFCNMLKYEKINSALVDKIVVNALKSLFHHEQKNPRFREVLVSSEIFPSRRRGFRRIDQLHDPEVQELVDLVGEDSVPAKTLSQPGVIEILRSLGLQSSLSCQGVVESSRYIQMLNTERSEESAKEAHHKAKSLLAVVNRCFDSMYESSKLTTDESGALMNALIDNEWLPVQGKPLQCMMPWRQRADGKIVSSAKQTRPRTDAWLCSGCLNILDGELQSKHLLHAFGWDELVSLDIIASQIRLIGEEFNSSSAIQGTTMDTDTRVLLREVVLLYEKLENGRVSLDGDNGNHDFDEVRTILTNASWIWTGKVFASPSQLAFEADDALQPLLFKAPNELVIPRMLLEAFGVRQKFYCEDYFTALNLLPRHTPLSEENTHCCLKIFELLQAFAADQASFQIPEEAVLLDRSNCLCSASTLMYDDMEWRESDDCRRGYQFVHRGIGKELALTLGASSLHSKMADSSSCSIGVSCVLGDALHRIFTNTTNSPCELFLRELLFSVEQMGVKAVHVVVDYRRHPSLKIIRPSFHALQQEAVCIVIEDVVWGIGDINRMFGSESARARPGLLSGFLVSDCLQIVSGRSFYVLDPCGRYINEPTLAGHEPKATGRKYDITSEDFAGCSDQLLPFSTLPHCSGNLLNGTRHTILRFPWRAELHPTSFSSILLSSNDADEWISLMKNSMVTSLIFTTALQRMSVWSLGKGSEYASTCHAEAFLENADLVLRQRSLTRKNNDWKKKFSFQSFFKAPATPTNFIEFNVRVEIENQQHIDSWLFADNIGHGRSRDIACLPAYESLQSVPYAAVAYHLLRDGKAAPRCEGHLFDGIDTFESTGLPVHINGCFKTRYGDQVLPIKRGGNQAELATHWNRVLVEDSCTEAYTQLFAGALRRCRGMHDKDVYALWPSLSKKRSEVGILIHKCFVRHSGTMDFFLCTDGSLRPLTGAYVIDSMGMQLQVESFARLHFPSFDVPHRVVRDCRQTLTAQIHTLTPKVMRKFLRNLRPSDINAGVCLPLLEYCLSDLSFPIPDDITAFWHEFEGLPILPLADGTTGVVQPNKRGNYLLATFNQQQLLPTLGKRFISLDAQRHLRHFFEDPKAAAAFGIGSFSIKVLSDNIHLVLPPHWRNEVIVNWNPSDEAQVSQLWLYRFWEEVRYDRRSLGFFSAWPLIPVQDSRLVSCSRLEFVLCVWIESPSVELQQKLHQDYEASSAASDLQLANLEEERRALSAVSQRRIGMDDEDSDDEEGEHAGEATVDSLSHSMLTDTEDESVQPETSTNESSDRHSENDGVLDGVAESIMTHGDLQSEHFPDHGLLESNSSELDETALEYCSRQRLHEVLSRLDAALIELAYFKGQEQEMVVNTREVSIAMLAALCSPLRHHLRWKNISEMDCTLLAEYFSNHNQRFGGFNRQQLDQLKHLPIFFNICSVSCAINQGDFFLISPAIELTAIPLPPNARQQFLKHNEKLSSLYRDLGIEEIGDSKLLTHVLPMFPQLLETQRDQILAMIQAKWNTLREDSAFLVAMSSMAIFRDSKGVFRSADSFVDPRSKLLSKMFENEHNRFPAREFQSDQWISIMSDIGLRSEITVELFVECATRIEALCGLNAGLTAEQESLVLALHNEFLQNYEKYDRSRSFYDQVSQLRFVPAMDYHIERSSGQLVSKCVLKRYEECAVPDDQALVFTVLPIISTSVVPHRMLWSRLGITSPPAKEFVLAHLKTLISIRAFVENWQFFVPRIEVFQCVFKYLQEHWSEMTSQDKLLLSSSEIIPIGSLLVKTSRVFFHLPENLNPLLFEIPRAFGAYDTLFRNLGSKDSPTLENYVELLKEIDDECENHALNLNELCAVVRIIELLTSLVKEADGRLSTELQARIVLPCANSTLRPLRLMAFNDAPWLYGRVDLSLLHIVHSRVGTDCCKILGVPGISSVVHEELQPDFQLETEAECDSIETKEQAILDQYNSILMTDAFANGIRSVITAQALKTAPHYVGFPDTTSIQFDHLNQRITDLAAFKIKSVRNLQSRFVARIGNQRVDVTKHSTANDSLSFIEGERRIIYLARDKIRSLTGLRISQVLARCINQLLGGAILDNSVLESMLMATPDEVSPLLRTLDVEENPDLVAERLRGMPGEVVGEADRAVIELTPLRTFLCGEFVAVEIDGQLQYGRVLREKKSGDGLSAIYVKVSKDRSRWMPSTQVFSFRSARSSVNKARATRRSIGPHSEDYEEQKNNTDGFPLMDTSSQEEGRASLLSQVDNGAESHHSNEVCHESILSAVNDLLARMNVSLDSSARDLLEQNERLRQRLERSEQAYRDACERIDEAVQRKREVLDALICSVCLECNVDRVLIPCGHIFCGTCISKLRKAECPICREPILQSSQFHAPTNL